MQILNATDQPKKKHTQTDAEENLDNSNTNSQSQQQNTKQTNLCGATFRM